MSGLCQLVTKSNSLELELVDFFGIIIIISGIFKTNSFANELDICIRISLSICA